VLSFSTPVINAAIDSLKNDFIKWQERLYPQYEHSDTMSVCQSVGLSAAIRYIIPRMKLLLNCCAASTALRIFVKKLPNLI